ncbi:MAG: 5-formyltetrahydrofolate cyclo-ligase [bacterium]
MKTLKEQLRHECISRRDAQSKEEIEEKSGRIASRLRSLPEYEAAHTVLFYASFRSEVATGAMIENAIEEGRKVCLPRVDGASKDLDIFWVKDPEADLAPGAWDIPEPRPDVCEKVPPEEIDLAIVPGVAFDREGNRLGFGGGYYDRFIPKLRDGTPKAGVAFDLQVIPAVTMGEFDQKVSIIVTETETIKCEKQPPRRWTDGNKIKDIEEG